MTDQELIEQFKRCQEWGDPDQWEFLAYAYYQQGYKLNALRCLQLADSCRVEAVEVSEMVTA